MVVPEHTFVGTIVTAGLGVLILNACLGGKIQIFLSVIKVYSTDLGKVSDIRTLEQSCASGIEHDIIKINLYGYCPIIDIINKVVLILNSHRCIFNIHIGVIFLGLILNQLRTRIRSDRIQDTGQYAKQELCRTRLD